MNKKTEALGQKLFELLYTPDTQRPGKNFDFSEVYHRQAAGKVNQILKVLQEEGYGKPVEGELPQYESSRFNNSSIAQYEISAIHKAQQDMLKANYVKFEPLEVD